MDDRPAAVVLRQWKSLPGGERVFLLSLTDGEIEAVSRVACKDSHALQQEALAFLKVLYDPADGAVSAGRLDGDGEIDEDGQLTSTLNGLTIAVAGRAYLDPERIG